MSARDKQVGGDHYKGYAIQPAEFITVNDLGFLEGCVIKRMCRWQEKGGVQDLRKAIHEIELLIGLTEMAEKRGHENQRTDFERKAIDAVAADTARRENRIMPDHPKRECNCLLLGKGATGKFCHCPPDMSPTHGFADLLRAKGDKGVPGHRPWDVMTEPPLAGSERPAYCLPEGADMPPRGTLADGTRVLVWRPRKVGDPGHAHYGWVEYGFIHEGRLVPYAPAV